MLNWLKIDKIALYTLLLVFFKANTQAQEVGIKVHFFGFADNREYKAPFTTPKTILGTRISPQAYLTLNNNHTIFTGIHYQQDFGTHQENKNQVDLIAYYNYQNTTFDFSFGFIPRSEKLSTIPRLVLADTFLYDRPNLEGMYLKYKKTNFYQAVYLDWISKQSQNEREEFIIGSTGRYRWNNIYFHNDALLYHKAFTSNNLQGDHIKDNAVLMLRLGLDLSNNLFLDSLSADIGFVGVFDRLRTEYTEQHYGFLSNIHLGYKSFYINNNLYLGQKLDLPTGDPFYKNGHYDRLDIGWVPFKTKNIEGKLTATFHFRKGGMDNQQAFTLRYNFGKGIWREK